MKTYTVLNNIANPNLYFFINRSKSKDKDTESKEPPLTAAEMREVEFLVHGGMGYTYDEATAEVISKRKKLGYTEFFPS
ncbi:MAG: hypothetical protein KF846_04740 [Cyclobacteriaceae bacterium]|nr:hypothetical protein [Cyclobacteriaceae bacterium]